MWKKKLHQITESEIINIILQQAGAAKSLGADYPGDDSALLPAPNSTNSPYVLSTDTMIEGVDFRTEWHPPRQLGFKAVTSSCADVAAMGGVVVGVLLACGFTQTLHLGWVRDFARGVARGITHTTAFSRTQSARLLGGDISRSHNTFISATAIGVCKNRPVLRSGARVGDIVALAGRQGESAAGLHLLQIAQKHFDSLGERVSYRKIRKYILHEMAEKMHQAGSDAKAYLGSHLAPRPDFLAAHLAAPLATSMIDISDGLLQDVDKIARASGVQIDLSHALLQPYIDRLAAFGRKIATRMVLHGGEDHGILATFPTNCTLPKGFVQIGEVKPLNQVKSGSQGETGQSISYVPANSGGSTQVTVDGKPQCALGWDPFRPHNPHPV